ncbi:MAG: DUF402 domain-containing protein [Acidobacteria bacterium]|jgi:protein associated with RNAse G/E|nr:DUF402 domain-containing protein [Acidobacteriota bacterium]
MRAINNAVTVNSRKIDNKIYRSWNASVIEQNKSSIILYGEFEEEIRHQHLGVIKPGTKSYEYYWFERWYSIFRFHEPDGSLRNFYCNVNQPPVFENNILDYVDLDIDVIVWKDKQRQILDIDEFESNAKKYRYSKQIVKKALESLRELLELIDKQQFPFNI